MHSLSGHFSFVRVDDILLFMKPLNDHVAVTRGSYLNDDHKR